MRTAKQKSALYFVTEQACCLAQATGMDTDEFRACRDAAEYLANGNSGAMSDFHEQTSAVKRDPTGLEDYDTESYEGKELDMRDAVIQLMQHGLCDCTPEAIRPQLLKTADMIADFYGVGIISEPVSA